MGNEVRTGNAVTGFFKRLRDKGERQKTRFLRSLFILSHLQFRSSGNPVTTVPRSDLMTRSLRKFYVPGLVLFFCCSAISAQEKTSVNVLSEKETRPLSFGIVVDNSASFRMSLDYVIRTAQAIAADMAPGDEAFLARFIGKDKIEITQDITANKDALIAAADDMYVEGGQTAIPE